MTLNLSQDEARVLSRLLAERMGGLRAGLEWERVLGTARGQLQYDCRLRQVMPIAVKLAEAIDR